MRVIGFITFFWLNALGLVVARQQVFIDHDGHSNTGFALLKSYLDLSFLDLLVFLSLVIIASEPALRRLWVYLVIVAPIMCFIAAVSIWVRQ